MDTAGEIAVLIKYTPKREKMLDTLKEQVVLEREAPNDITKLSTTRWTVRANSFQRILDNYSYLFDLWDEVRWKAFLSSLG